MSYVSVMFLALALVVVQSHMNTQRERAEAMRRHPAGSGRGK